MLIGFSVRNYRSFLNAQSCSFLASRDDAHEDRHCIQTGVNSTPRLIKSAVVFGANASGKSNLLSALATLRDLVVNSTTLSSAQFAEHYDPFRLDHAANLPTVFDIEVLLNGVRYQYSLAYDAQHVVCEQLRVFAGRKAQRWFERRHPADRQGVEWMPFSSNFLGPREMWRRATRPTALFLTTAAKLNAEQLQPLLHWFEHHVDVVLTSDVGNLTAFADCMRHPPFKQRVLQILQAIDVRVEDVRMVDVRSGPRATIEFLHTSPDGHSAWIEFSQEAAGVKRLIALLGPLLCAIDEGKLAAIDEFDCNLHPLVSRFLIELFNDPAISSKQAQLLLSSHNLALMDLDLLRRDEIWLMDLGDDQSSRLSAMSRGAARKHELVAKGYLKGRFGAIPGIAGLHRSESSPAMPEYSED